jgi:putrescine:ornithine antiporter
MHALRKSDCIIFIPPDSFRDKFPHRLILRYVLRKKGTTLSKSKKMGVVQLTTVTAINMMGSGIILLPATLASIGTISIFSWILASIGATILAYAFARCGMLTRKVGGMGGYAEYRFGRAGNFLSNFTYTISLIIANVAIASGVVSYASFVFGLKLDPVEVCAATIGVLTIAATISLVGPKKFGKFTSLGVTCVVTPVIGLLLFGFFSFDPDIYVTAWNPSDMPFYECIKDSIAVIIWAFLGLETACANSDTVENPEKNVPIAVMCGTMLAGICYTISTSIIGGLVPYTELMNAGAPFGLAYAAMFGPTAGYIVSCMLVCSCFVSLTAWQFTVSEVAREASSIGLFPKFLSVVNRFRSPYVAIGSLLAIQIAMTLSTMSPTLLKQFNILINLAVMINLIPYLLAMAAVPDLQKAEGISSDKARMANIAAVVGGIYSCYAVYGCGWAVIFEGAFVTAMGLVIYAVLSSRLRYNPSSQVSTFPPVEKK